jgi:hypothetical protein
VICRASYYIHRVLYSKCSCARNTAVFRTVTPTLTTPRQIHSWGEGSRALARGGGEAPLTGSRVREPSGEDRGVQPLRIVPARARRRAGSNRCRLERDGASAVAKPGAIQTAALRSKGGGGVQLDKRPCGAVIKAAQRRGKRRRSPKAPPPRGYLNRWTSALTIVTSAAA